MKATLQVVGWVLLISQGIIPLAQKFSGNELGSFQLAKMLPVGMQVPASIGAIVVAVLVLVAARAASGSAARR